jgi:hypothetical protein
MQARRQVMAGDRLIVVGEVGLTQNGLDRAPLSMGK